VLASVRLFDLRKYERHEDRYIEAGFGLFAIMHISLKCRNTTALRDIPRWSIVDMFRVQSIRRSLTIYAEHPDTKLDPMNDKRNRREENFHDMHDTFNQEYKSAQDRDDKIELSKTANQALTTICTT
jgi:hypothetical protein